MRKLAFLLLTLALPLFADTFENVIIRDGKHSFSYGDTDDLDGLGGRYASFERNGVRYVIRDEATLDRLLKELQPQIDLGHEQAKIGEKQAELGQQQAAIGAKQATHWNDRELSRELEEKQRRLADQQRPLADQQRVLADKQREASRRAKVRMATIFEVALRNGVAKRR